MAHHAITAQQDLVVSATPLGMKAEPRSATAGRSRLSTSVQVGRGGDEYACARAA